MIIIKFCFVILHFFRIIQALNSISFQVLSFKNKLTKLLYLFILEDLYLIQLFISTQNFHFLNFIFLFFHLRFIIQVDLVFNFPEYLFNIIPLSFNFQYFYHFLYLIIIL